MNKSLTSASRFSLPSHSHRHSRLPQNHWVARPLPEHQGALHSQKKSLSSPTPAYSMRALIALLPKHTVSFCISVPSPLVNFPSSFQPGILLWHHQALRLHPNIFQAAFITLQCDYWVTKDPIFPTKPGTQAYMTISTT